MRTFKPKMIGTVLRSSHTRCQWCQHGVDPYPRSICEPCRLSFKRLLTSHRWAQLRSSLLNTVPTCYCQHCSAIGLTVAATEIDHIKPWSHFPSLFWIDTNFQPLCGICHRKKTEDDQTLYGGYGS